MREIDFLDAVGRVDQKYIDECVSFWVAFKEGEKASIKRKTKKRPLIVLIAAISLILLLSLAAGAKYLPNFSDVLSEYLGILTDREEDLSRAVCEINQSQTYENLTVTVEQAFGDAHAAYILVTASLPGESLADGKFIDPILKCSFDGSYNCTLVSYDEETLTQTYIIEIISSNKKLTGKRIDLEFGSFFCGNPMQKINGNWKFSFKLDFDDLSKSITVNKKIDDKITVRSVWFSPASIIIYVDGLPEEMRRLDDFDVILTDGEKADLSKYQVVGDIPSGSTTPIFSQCNTLIDPEDVKCIIVNGVEISLGDTE
ncbi:MAG: DUF4179 domain-containing protein [Ruminococcaceae bacterium]|nr:DUF4179 domain-containing protein [Oscillospiraceae bacterium]